MGGVETIQVPCIPEHDPETVEVNVMVCIFSGEIPILVYQNHPRNQR